METKQRYGHADLFRKGIDKEKGFRSREETSIRIRKEKREKQVQQRRKMASQVTIQGNCNIQSAIPDIFSAVATQQLNGTTKIRKMLSIPENPPIAEVVAAGCISRFVSFLDRHEIPTLQFEAAWALTNITSGESKYTEAVIQSGAIPLFIKLINSPNRDVCEQSTWALGNIAGDSITCRNLVTQMGIVEPLLNILNRPGISISVLRIAAWTLSNLYRGKPYPPFQFIHQSMPTLSKLIYHKDEEVVSDICWSISYIADGGYDNIRTVIESGLCMKLVELLSHSAYSIQVPALRAVGNILTGSDEQTQVMVDCGTINQLLRLMTSHKRSIKKEATWSISNILAGSQSQIQSAIDANIIPQLIWKLKNDEFAIKKEAAWAISNATSGGTPEQIRYIVARGCISPICELLDCYDANFISAALEALENILKVGNYVDDIESAGGLDKLEELQSHENTSIYSKAVHILETYFLDDNTNESETQVGQPVFSFTTGFT